MERWNAWWWAPDEWRTGPGIDGQAPTSGKGGGGGGGRPAYKAPDPAATGDVPADTGEPPRRSAV